MTENLPNLCAIRQTPCAICQLQFAKKRRQILRAKKSRVNVDEIDPWSQFHQHFIGAIAPIFLANILAQIKSLTSTASTKKLRAKLSYEKGVRKMLVKLTLVD